MLHCAACIALDVGERLDVLFKGVNSVQKIRKMAEGILGSDRNLHAVLLMAICLVEQQMSLL